jgi:hypothetical protein
MEGSRFDAWTRRGVGAVGIAALAAFGIGGAGAKKRKSGKTPRKRKRKQADGPPLERNVFGCVDVGKPCRGESANCCSGICEGNRPAPGKPDASRCAAHHTNGCTPERGYCAVGAGGGALCCPSGTDVYCLQTTGNAGFCTDYAKFKAATDCHACTRDTECEALGYPPGSACIYVPDAGFCGGTCEATGDRGCAAPFVA